MVILVKTYEHVYHKSKWLGIRPCHEEWIITRSNYWETLRA